jgi:hypothetical protein
MSEKLALFDPVSYYNRLRACVRPEDKLRGFFHWLHVRDRYALAQSKPAGQQEPLRRVLSAQRPEKVHEADVQASFVPDDHGRVCFALSVQLRQPAGDAPRKKGACRAYLVEHAVLERLRAADPSLRDAADDALLAKVFDNERVTTNGEVARILSALPELEDTLDEQGHADFQPFPLPENCPMRSLPGDIHVVVVADLWLWEKVLKDVLFYLNEPAAPPAATPTEWDCLLLALRQPSPLQGLTPNEVRDRLARRSSLAVISDALQTAREKGYLVEEQREAPASETQAAIRTRGGAGGPETVYRLVPRKMAAALCHGLLAGTVPPSGEVRQALLGLVETLGVPPEILEQLRKG